jgi:hypothetical protein
VIFKERLLRDQRTGSFSDFNHPSARLMDAGSVRRPGTVADLVRSELATVRVKIVGERDSKIEVALVRITDAGWRLLEGLTARRPPPCPPGDRFGLRNTLAAVCVGFTA